MTKHDTAAIRKLAGQIDHIADNLSDTEQNAAKKITGAAGDMLGDTPEAIGQANSRLSGELQSIRSGLAQYAAMLYRYAHELDLADARAKALINSK